MNRPANMALELLTMKAELLARFERQFNFSEWLLANGEAFGPSVALPEGKRMMRKKRCFDNSARVLIRGEVDRSEWFYTEGVVAVPGCPIDIDHAWLSNRKGEVLDFTLRQNRRAHYFGIPFDAEAVFAAALVNGHYGMFSDGIRYYPSVISGKILLDRAWKKGERE